MTTASAGEYDRHGLQGLLESVFGGRPDDCLRMVPVQSGTFGITAAMLKSTLPPTRSNPVGWMFVTDHVIHGQMPAFASLTFPANDGSSALSAVVTTWTGRPSVRTT